MTDRGTGIDRSSSGDAMRSLFQYVLNNYAWRRDESARLVDDRPSGGFARASARCLGRDNALRGTTRRGGVRGRTLDSLGRCARSIRHLLGLRRSPALALHDFTVFFRGQQHVVRARDRMHARVIAYAVIWPESKWGEVE